ncbi:hypothetical protein PO909_020272 [Leuciscus waleckii]
MGGSLVPAHVKEMDYVAAVGFVNILPWGISLCCMFQTNWPLQLCLSDFNGCTMLLGSPWSVQVLLALSVLTLGLDSEPQSAPRVFLSFKGIAAPVMWPVVWRNRVNVLEYTFFSHATFWFS